MCSSGCPENCDEPIDRRVSVKTINLTINGESYRVNVKDHWSLAYTVREHVGLTGTKTGCEMGTCGSCTMLIDNEPAFSCLKMAVDCDNVDIRTIEGVEDHENNELHPLQSAFVEHHGMQCGYCTPGMIVAAKSLLDETPDPSAQEVKEAIAGHICRCGTYPRIVKSILAAAETLRNG
jgi:aerobic-type carbon monoxide dehydrogenase small subunit (CoxS/CutS family)